MVTLGERLRMLREEKGFTLEYVATQLNTTKTTISRYENNDREPKSETLSSLADFYNVSTDFLLCRTDNRGSDVLNKDIKTIAAHKINPLEGLSEDAINKINEYIEMVTMMEKNKK